MTRQTSSPLRPAHLSPTNRAAREVARMANEGWIDLSPSYQRDSVWTEPQRVALVKSWLLGIPVGAVTINDRVSPAWTAAHGGVNVLSSDGGANSYAAVDGKQRIITAQMWFNGELAVPSSWFDAEDVLETVETDDGPYVRYDQLSKVRRSDIGFKFLLPVIEAKLATHADEADLFLLLNGGGTPQTERDMERARAHAHGA